MTVSDLSLSAISITGIYMFLLTAFFMFGSLGFSKSHSTKPLKAVNIVCAALSFCIAYSFASFYAAADGRRVFNAYDKLFGTFNFYFICAAIAALTAAAVITRIMVTRLYKRTITPASVQEALDKLPDGVCVSTLEGLPLFVNRKMHNVSYSAFGTVVLDALDFEQSIKTSAKNGTFILLNDGTAWKMKISNLSVGQLRLREYIAYDVTEQYRKHNELKNRNEHLARVNKKIRDVSLNMDSIVREKEILASKIRLHDNVGRSLLALRAYLSQTDGDRQELLLLWKSTTQVLNRDASTMENESRLDILRKAAQAVDVSLKIEGEVPPKYERLIEIAIHECLTNTVKHADGTELHVKLSQDKGKLTAELTNNGKPPQMPVAEKGGLKNLRRMTELYDAQMVIESLPRFILRITV